MKSKRGLKILAVVVAAIIVLLVLASVVVKIIFTKDKLLSLLVPRIESTLDRKVEIEEGRQRLHLGWSGGGRSRHDGLEQTGIFSERAFQIR